MSKPPRGPAGTDVPSSASLIFINYSLAVLRSHPPANARSPRRAPNHLPGVQPTTERQTPRRHGPPLVHASAARIQGHLQFTQARTLFCHSAFARSACLASHKYEQRYRLDLEHACLAFFASRRRSRRVGLQMLNWVCAVSSFDFRHVADER